MPNEYAKTDKFVQDVVNKGHASMVLPVANYQMLESELDMLGYLDQLKGYCPHCGGYLSTQSMFHIAMNKKPVCVFCFKALSKFRLVCGE